MKLYGSLTSPFVRKVRIVAAETGQTLARVNSAPTPLSVDDWLPAKNPLGKIPILELADGSLLYDSRVICEYLDSLHTGPRLIPSDAGRWRVLRQQALADGILDAGILMRYETVLRPEALQWPAWIEAEARKLLTGLDQLESEAGGFAATPDLGLIAIACALDWLMFRDSLAVLPGEPIAFDARWPRLMDWLQRFGQRPALQDTRPQ